MSFMREVYAVSSEYLGLSEISGPKDNRMIEVAHRLCNIEGDAGGSYTDEIPWCSSWIVLCMVLANIRRNPKVACDVLRKRGIKEGMIIELFVFAKVDYNKMKDIDTGVVFIHPTWSASSKSWDTWGVEVPNAQAQRGDLLRLTRDGGGHITQMDEDKLGLIMLKCLGGNQSNKVTSSTSYLRSRLVHIRRAKEDVASAPSVPPTSEDRTDEPKPTLRRGDKGQYVTLLQNRLNQLSFVLKVDGDFGPQTDSVVRAYQQVKGLKVDGIVGPKTWAALMGGGVNETPQPEPVKPPTDKITTGQDADEGTEPWYRRMFAACEIDAGKEAQVAKTVKTVEAGYARYLAVAKRIGAAVPENFAWILGVIHFKEASCNFAGVLHNGEKIVGTGRKTSIVPKGRGPFATWEDAAVDALVGESSRWKKLIEGGNDIGDILYALERYNGTGYISGAGKAETSPYLWACSNINDGAGKYVSDGKFDPNASTQSSAGAAVILKELYKQGKFKIQA